MPDTPPTVAVLTAQPLEYTAVRAHLTDIEKRVHPTGTRAETGQLPGTSWRVALLEMGEGTREAAALTERVTSWFKPDAVLFVGTAVGLREDIRVGDVVIATKVYAVHGGKETPDGFLDRPESWHTPHRFEQAARYALRGHQHTHFKPIAAGDVTVADPASPLAQRIHRHFNDAVAVETEGSGVAHTAHLAGTAGALIIRGISSRAGAEADNETAAANAAEAAVAVLRELEPKPTLTAPPAPTPTHGPVPTATAVLPPRPLGFTGRSAELERLLPHLAPTSPAAPGVPVLIFAVTGMGGIGKTALAIEAAHRARGEGWFPGGTLFVDLRGYDDNPVTADQAVVALLDALGVRGPDLPHTTAQQYDRYRQLLTEQRERTLLVLDNSSDPSQFRPLLPGTDRHRVLITSRDRPHALPVRLIDLESLTPDESAALITRALHDTDERDDRPAREPDALHELTALCGHLPLALQIAAGMLRKRRYRGISSLVTEIKEAEDPTAVLDKGSPGSDLYGRSLVLRPVLETSYRRLPPDQAQLLRLLALAPGVETGTEAVAALADVTVATALTLLEDLAATHLVAPVEGVDGSASGGRWRLHDLVRAFGVGVVRGDTRLREEGEAARERVLEFYHRWARAADSRLRWLPGIPVPERFGDRVGALAWLDSERAGLVAAVGWAERERFAGTAVRLAACLGEYLNWRRYIDDWVTVGRAAVEAARRSGDRTVESIAWDHLGSALREAGRVEEAIEAHTLARDLHQAAENRHGEAVSWGNLGSALRVAGRVTEAIEALTRARDLFQAAGNRHSQAIVWHNLGVALREAGRVEEAIEAHTLARDLFQAAEDRHGEAGAWGNLGSALRKKGRMAEAVEAYAKALEVYREFEDWYSTGKVLYNLALLHEDAGRSPEARTCFLQSADAFTQANAPTEAAQARTRAAEQQ